VNFQMSEIWRMWRDFFNIEMFPYHSPMTDRYTAEMCVLADNYAANMDVVGTKDIVLGRFAALTFPIVAYANEHQEEAAALIAACPAPADFEAFTRLAVHRVATDRCQLAAWFWIGRHNMPSTLVFRAVQICCALLDFRRTVNKGFWRAVDAPDCWQEVLAFLPPNECSDHFQRISALPVQLSLPTSELTRMTPPSSKLTARDIRARLYEFFQKTPGGDIEMFKTGLIREMRRGP
jgi:hypothetical protein